MNKLKIVFLGTPKIACNALSELSNKEDIEITDEDLIVIFTNLQTIVRIHEDGAVLSYNIEEQSMN